MIISFGSQLPEDIFYLRRTGVTKKFPPELHEVARRKLQYLNSAEKLSDLNSPPGNRLEALRGKWRGFYSIRINNQWRIVFRWEDGAKQVQIVDYH